MSRQEKKRNKTGEGLSTVQAADIKEKPIRKTGFPTTVNKVINS